MIQATCMQCDAVVDLTCDVWEQHESVDTVGGCALKDLEKRHFQSLIKRHVSFVLPKPWVSQANAEGVSRAFCGIDCCGDYCAAEDKAKRP